MRSPFLIAAIALLSLAPIPGFADQALVVDMNPPPDKSSHSSIELRHETLGATRIDSERQGAVQASAAKEQVVGQVGVIVAPKAAIKRQPSRKSHSLYTCPKDTYLAVVGQRGAWYGILMSDSSTGWIQKDNVNLLDYRVTNAAVTGQTTTSGNRIVDTAVRYLGISYKYGGYSSNGIDCSGFVKAVFASNGIGLPRTAHEQALVGMPVTFRELQPGDRLYFACKGGAVDHAGIYIGNGYFIHSSSGRGGVAVDPITKSKFLNSLVVARR